MGERFEKPEVAVKHIMLWPPGVFLACLALGISGHVAMPLQALPVVPARVIGVVLIGLALALARWAQQTMRAAKTNIHPWKPTLALDTSGPFQRMRVLRAGASLGLDAVPANLMRLRWFVARIGSPGNRFNSTVQRS